MAMAKGRDRRATDRIRGFITVLYLFYGEIC
jgi:hypothetical protein